MSFLVVVVAEGVIQKSPERQSFPRGVGGKNEASSLIARRCIFGDENIKLAAVPTLVLVKGPACLIKALFLDILVGALNERLNVLRGSHGTGHDRVFRARNNFSSAKRWRHHAR